MTDKALSSKYRRYRKDEAVACAFFDGVKMGLLISGGGEFDYGFGPKGLGTYIYKGNKILAFLPDY